MSSVCTRMAFLIVAMHILTFFSSVVILGDARVVDNMSDCNPSHFYQNTPPIFTDDNIDGLKAVCQTLNNQELFATLYSTTHRVPIYSAYRVDDISCDAKPRRSPQWKLEPQLAGKLTHDQNMVWINRKDSRTYYRGEQAIEEDFDTTGYDRGHLNANQHHCKATDRNATYTLTNAVPQDPCFNGEHWKEMETKAYNAFKQRCFFPGARRYVVTGATVLGNYQMKYIPVETDRFPDTPADKLHRVLVPSHMWSAVCCDTSLVAEEYRHLGWSYAYIGENQAVSNIQALSVDQLEAKLNVRLFAAATVTGSTEQIEHCNFSPRLSEEEKSRAERVAMRQNLRLLRKNPQMESLKRELQRVEDLLANDHPYAKYIKYSAGVKAQIFVQEKGFETNDFLFDLGKNDLACYINSLQVARTSVQRIRRTSLAVAASNNVLQCQVKDLEEEGHITTSGRRCRLNHYCGAHGGTAYNWCYIDSRNNWGRCCKQPCDYRHGYRDAVCYDGSAYQTCIKYRILDTTLKGQLCRRNHQCGSYGVDHYWCYTDEYDNWDYCCAPYHTCGKHGESYNWCETWHKWDYCTPPVNLDP